MKKLASLCSLLLALSILSAADGEFYAANQSVFILPTAYTMPKGSSALTDYELLILQYAYAASDRLHISAGMVFPVVEDAFETFSLGGKFNYYRGKSMESAVWGTYTFDSNLFTLGNVLSFGGNKNDESGSIHLAGMLLGNLESDNIQGVLGTGGIVRFSNLVNGMMELFFAPFNVKGDPGGLLNLDGNDYALLIAGIRFKGHKVSVDLGGMRPMGDVELDELLLFPFLKATILF